MKKKPLKVQEKLNKSKKTTFLILKKKFLKKKKLVLLNKSEKTKTPKDNLYRKFLGSLVKNGNKNAASRILRAAFLKASIKSKVTMPRIFTRIFKGLNTFVEVKKVKKRKNTHFIPFPVQKKRNEFLKVQWILDASKEDLRGVKFSDKLYVEILNLLFKKKKSKVLLKKKMIKKEVLKHKANAHFRW